MYVILVFTRYINYASDILYNILNNTFPNVMIISKEGSPMPDLSNLFNFIDEKNTQYISDQTGISTGNICDWKSGRSKPSAESLVIVAEALNCSVD